MDNLKLTLSAAWNYFLVTGMTFALGLYITYHDDHLGQYYFDQYIGWIDSGIFGLFVVITASLMIYALLSEHKKLIIAMIIAQGGIYFSIFFVYFIRNLLGDFNISWILSGGIFMLIIGLILRGGNQIERPAI